MSVCPWSVGNPLSDQVTYIVYLFLERKGQSNPQIEPPPPYHHPVLCFTIPIKALGERKINSQIVVGGMDYIERPRTGPHLN